MHTILLHKVNVFPCIAAKMLLAETWAELENAFDIEMETDDVVDFSSFDAGKEKCLYFPLRLSKYAVSSEVSITSNFPFQFPVGAASTREK